MALLRFAVLVFALFHPLLAYADQSADLYQRAQERGIAESKEWLRLLHYEKRFDLFDRRSLIDDRAFFLSSGGVRDPAAELQSTLAGFFEPVSSDPDAEHPQCRFRARYQYLKGAIGFTATELPEVKCPRFDEWIAALDPGSLTLIYPASYLNNPASMYGHTLLRVDPSSYGSGGEILGYGIGYTAAVDPHAGVAFAVKGIFGGYKGYFTILPYYVQVGRYGDIEHRDIWEYRLNLTREESIRLLEHLWELKETVTDYYFFDENCSYLLLALLEIARPELELTESFPLWTIPTDTVKAVLEEKGLVLQRNYRPSAASVVSARAMAASVEVKKEARLLAEGDHARADSLAPADRIAAIDLALDLLELKGASEADEKKIQDERRFELLRQRRQLPASPPVPVPEPVAPEEGHGSQRFAYSLGKEGSSGYQDFEYRPAYHDQLDDPKGFTKGAEVEFFMLKFRHREEENLLLEQFTPVEIFSLSPVNEFSRSLSWRLDFGAVRRHFEDSTALAGYLEAGPGVAVNLFDSATLYVLAEFSAETSEGFADRYALGAGVRSGMTLLLSEPLRFRGEGTARRYGVGEEHSRFSAGASLQFDLTSSIALRAALTRKQEVGAVYTEPSISLQWYF